MNEIVIPAVKEQKPDKVEIYFKPFLPEGETRWLDENGATPSYHNLQADNPDKWYDLPIRYLQELYPIEDVLIGELGIPRDAVVFLPYEGEERLTYLCRVYQGQAICYENTYEARCSERPYLDEYPQMGKFIRRRVIYVLGLMGRKFFTRISGRIWKQSGILIRLKYCRTVSGILRKRMEESLHRNSSRFSRSSYWM